MLRYLLLSLLALPLLATIYPAPFSALSHPLYKTRVTFDALAQLPSMRRVTLDYVVHSDRVLGHYMPIKMSSSKTEKQAYYRALLKLQEEQSDLVAYAKSRLGQIIDENNYHAFLIFVNTKSPVFYEDAYLREKIYTYYHAHRSEKVSPYLDQRIKEEWADLSYYYPKKPLFNYTSTDNAFYREVVLITTQHSPYGKKLHDFLTYGHVKFKELDLEKDEEAKELFKKYKGNGIPLLIINNNTLTGYNQLEVDKLLRH